MVFIGIDHSTTAIRVAILDRDEDGPFDTYEIMKSGKDLDFVQTIKDHVKLDDIEMMGLSYSMGDAICALTPIEKVLGRGVLSLDDIGPVTGIGTKMFDGVKASGLPAVVIPGLHRGCKWLDRSFTLLQSHVASPKKVAAAYYCYLELNKRMEASDIVVTSLSSNTVSILIKKDRVVGGIDAVLGAPGLRHGPLDVEALRRIDKGDITANEAFSTAGLMGGYASQEALMSAFETGDNDAVHRVDAMTKYVAMEISGLITISHGVQAIAITGALGEVKNPIDMSSEIGRMLGRKVYSFTRFSAAIGAARMAVQFKDGASEILGIPVDHGH